MLACFHRAPVGGSRRHRRSREPGDLALERLARSSPRLLRPTLRRRRVVVINLRGIDAVKANPLDLSGAVPVQVLHVGRIAVHKLHDLHARLLATGGVPFGIRWGRITAHEGEERHK
jgi:hypothetical protein